MLWIKIVLLTLIFGLALHFIVGALQPHTVEECSVTGWVAEGSDANIGDKSCYKKQVGFSIGYPRYATQYIKKSPCGGSDYIESRFSSSAFLVNVLFWNGIIFLLSFFYYRKKKKDNIKLRKGKLIATIIISLIILGIYWLVTSFVFAYMESYWTC